MLLSFDYLWKKYGIESKLAVHFGANTGQERKEYQAVGVERVIWVEAHPKLFEELSGNIYCDVGSRALRACLSDKDGEKVIFNVANNGGQSSSFLEFGTHSKAHPDVHFVENIEMTTTRFDTLIYEQGIPIGLGGFLTVDLQGAELKALKGMGWLLGRFYHASIEVNEKELYIGCPLVKDIDDYLIKFGFEGRETKMTPHGWGEKYYERSN